MQLCGVCVELRRGQSAPLTLTTKHLQSALKSLFDCALQRGPLPHSVPAQLGAAGAQQGEDAAAEAAVGVGITLSTMSQDENVFHFHTSGTKVSNAPVAF